jgi:hypothetical protein
MLQARRGGGRLPTGPGVPRQPKVPKWQRDYQTALAELDVDTLPTISRIVGGEGDLRDLMRVDAMPSTTMLEREKAMGKVGKALDDEATKRATKQLAEAGLEHPEKAAKLADAAKKASWDANSELFQWQNDKVRDLRRIQGYADAERSDLILIARQLPEYARLEALSDRLEADALRLARLRDDAEAAYVPAFRDHLGAVLREVRPMGGQLPISNTVAISDDLGAPSVARLREVTESLTQAADFYPTGWIDRINASPVGEVRPGWSARGYQRGNPDGSVDVVLSDSAKGVVKASDTPHLRVATHELGHVMETYDERVRAMEWTFYSRRTSTVDRTYGYLKDRQAAIDMGGNMAGEMARPDKFLNVYMGKDYGGGPGGYYELVAMGQEGIWTGTNGLPWKDADYRRFIIGLLGSL